MRSVIFLVILASSLAHGQAADKTLTFDAASIKPSEMPSPGGGRMMRFGRGSGGPGTSDPGRVRYPFTTVKALLTIAYDVKPYQITGPTWLDSERFDVQATMPPETTKEQFRTMLQNLIAERFKATVHRETKELPMYSLTVAKGGPKMKESGDPPPDTGEPAAPPPLPGPGQMKFDKDGFPILPIPAGGRGGIFQMMMPNRARMIAQRQTMQEFAAQLSNVLSNPVTDLTELTAKYDFTLTYSPEGLNSGMIVMPARPPEGGVRPVEVPDAETPPTIFAAVQSELGLKLDAKKGPVELIVVDHMEKVPTEN
jgi:uncharacterized protein (TIGR03435 family)